MNAIRTTPPQPLDITALFPQLTPLARTVTRLHPRPGAADRARQLRRRTAPGTPPPPEPGPVPDNVILFWPPRG
ncbi:hypothetical protein [Streptomyces avermitilis]|uniref:hypothetical protein n=1 Tax=Streptomyces avermitilis TaxID=33903 RepID=UPI003678D7AA